MTSNSATWVSLLALVCSLSAFGQSQEETVVRTAYAKLAYAVDMNAAYRLVTEDPHISPAKLAAEVEAQGLRFRLSNFKVGNLTDIDTLNASYDVLGQYPDGQDIIQTSLSTITVQDGNAPKVTTKTATAQWVLGPSATPPSDLTVAQMLPIMEKESSIGPLRRYATYTVTATLAGRSRTYRASFLFGDDGKVATADVVSAVGGGPLWEFSNTGRVYPDIFLKTHIARNPAIKNLLFSNQRLDPSCKAGEVCCDTTVLHCGVPSADLGLQ